MYQLLIVEDEWDQVSVTEGLISRSPFCDILKVNHVTSASALASYLKEGNPIDILLMDIELGLHKQNGIEAVQELIPDRRDIQVVYLTGYIEYCTRAYRTKHLYFLSKPANQEDFDDALRQAISNLKENENESLLFRVGPNDIRVLPSDIFYIESQRRKVCVYARGNEIQTYATMSELMQVLPKYFIQCHKSFIVNLNYISEIQKENVLLLSGDFVPVSQKRRKTVRDDFFAHLRNRLK